jgi:hypothetical protein
VVPLDRGAGDAVGDEQPDIRRAGEDEGLGLDMEASLEAFGIGGTGEVGFGSLRVEVRDADRPADAEARDGGIPPGEGWIGDQAATGPGGRK